MKYYVITVNDAGELTDLTYELLTCEHCRYFNDPDNGSITHLVCKHPNGMVTPMYDGFCSYADEREEDD